MSLTLSVIQVERREQECLHTQTVPVTLSISPRTSATIVFADTVVIFLVLTHSILIEGFKADEKASQPGLYGKVEQPGIQDRADCSGALPDAIHTDHTPKQRCGENRIAENVIVKEKKMSAGQLPNLGKGLVYWIRIEMAAPTKE